MYHKFFIRCLSREVTVRVQGSHRSKNNLTAFDRGSDTCQLVLMYMSTCVLAQGWFGYRDVPY